MIKTKKRPVPCYITQNRAIKKEKDYKIREALADWLRNYDMNSWNGECFDIDDGLRLYPIYGDEDEGGCFPIIDYKIA